MRDLFTLPSRAPRLPLFGVALAVCTTLAGCDPMSPELTRRERAERVIAALGACVPSVAGGGQVLGLGTQMLEQELLIGGPVYSFGGPFMTATMIDCIARTEGDCGRVRACLGLEVEVVPDCTGVEDRCDGTTLVRCVDAGTSDPPRIVRSDCRAIGLTCVESSTGRPVCGTRACTEPDLTITCDGREVTSCFEGVSHVGTCRHGEVCDVEFGGCIGAGPACVGDACDGDVFLPCGSGGRVSTPIDCAELGQRCTLLVEGVVGCVPPDGSECQPSAAPSCTDAVIRYCARDGSWRTFDCVEHGYAGCSDGRCVPRD